jgi:hypothetical protein
MGFYYRKSLPRILGKSSRRRSEKSVASPAAHKPLILLPKILQPISHHFSQYPMTSSSNRESILLMSTRGAILTEMIRQASSIVLLQAECLFGGSQILDDFFSGVCRFL